MAITVADEQEALDAVFHLDRKIRTGRYEQQLEAIDSIPAILDGTNRVSPAIAGTVYLRLTAFFVSSSASNELRRYIVQSLSACVDHSTCIAGQENEIVKRLGALWESNDILARAAVIGMYRAMANGISHNAEAIFRIQQSLCSEYDEEIDSAISALERFVPLNSEGILPFISEAVAKLILSGENYHSERIIQMLDLYVRFRSYDAGAEYLLLNSLEGTTIESNARIASTIATLKDRLGLSLLTTTPKAHTL